MYVNRDMKMTRWNRKERWRMTEDDSEEPSMTIAESGEPQMTGQARGKEKRDQYN